jgi:uncharacterized membrane protein YraQ (UPF0718 family)
MLLISMRLLEPEVLLSSSILSVCFAIAYGMVLTHIVAIAAGTLLPYLNARDRRLLKPTHHKDASEIDEDGSDEEEEDVEMDKIREMVREWKAEAARHGRPLKLPTSELLGYVISGLPALYSLVSSWALPSLSPKSGR